MRFFARKNSGLPPDQTAVRFKFAPLLGGDWQIDDVYVDPRLRN